MALFGIKTNKCFQDGVQGVCNKFEYENTSGSSVIFSVNGPKNNALYIFKEYSAGAFGLMPLDPSPDFNFTITLQNTEGFTGVLNAQVSFYYSDLTTQLPQRILLKWDNPDFDPTDGYTVIHIHVWHDGINYCGRVDGYIETT